MNRLQSIIHYFCRNYPYPGELSKARVTKMVYLADWKSAQRRGEQLTGINWVFNHYGPYVEDVIEAAESTSALEVVRTTNMYGTPKVLVQEASTGSGVNIPIIPSDVVRILDEVIAETAPLSFNSFVKSVYDTFPIRTADRYDELNLSYLARQEKNR